jgi:hypothetical protein
VTSDDRSESIVDFLNVDVELYGAFDRAALLRGFGDQIVVLYEGTDPQGEPAISFELCGVNLTAEAALAALIALVRALPEDARTEWNAAKRRVFDIGIQSGRAPHSTHWSIDANVLAALGDINVDLVVTVYGADLGSEAGTAPAS